MSEIEPKWETIDRSLVHDGRVILYDHTVALPDGSHTQYEVDASIPFAAAVLLVSGGHVLVTRQYRYPINRWIFDLPAGGAQDDEEPIDTARRELEKEAGIVPISLVPLHTFFLNPGRASWPVHLFFSSEATTSRTASRDDPAEQVSAVWLRVEELDSLIVKGEIVDPALIIARTMAASRELMPPLELLCHQTVETVGTRQSISPARR